MRGASVLVVGGTLAAAIGCAAAPRGPCEGVACGAACPRDAFRSDGRCSCAEPYLAVLGACLEPRNAYAFCGAAGHAGPDGCAFRGCGGGESLDVATGKCIPMSLVHGGTSWCAPGAEAIVEEGRAACIPAADACPRGTKRLTDSRGVDVCVGPPRCHAGTVAVGGPACWPIVTGTPRGPRVDVGAWVAFALVPDGGVGSDVLCRPIAPRPAAFGISPGHGLDVWVTIALAIPDQDMTRVHALVSAREADARVHGGELASPARTVVQASVDALVDALRGLGGEASAAAANVAVRCSVQSL